jgi:hypothetical protein
MTTSPHGMCMHYLFFDESYPRKSHGKIILAGWAVEQDRLNRRRVGLKELSKTPVLNSINEMLEDLGALAVVATAALDSALFRSGAEDGTDDVARMSRTDNIWTTCSTLLVNTLLAEFFSRGKDLATIDIYHDPKSLTSDHEEARRKALRGLVVRHAKEASVARGNMLFKKLNIRRIESVAKPLGYLNADKFQVGIWVSDKLCSSADAVQGRRFSRIRGYDMSEEVRRTIQQFDGKKFEDN